MILGPDGQPARTPAAPIVAPDGSPATAPDERPATMADLQGLLLRMGAAADRLSPSHPHRTLFIESAQWMANLARSLVEAKAQLVAIQEGIINPDGSAKPVDEPRDWRGLRLVPQTDVETEQPA